ncbi:methyltransferase [uncultured Massilia sp.]|uniref:methyltransferase n=1 Tax=uncultured Massilia sp. TaxID=169973 RepID=UPI0025E5CE47|nr:methyltransferase [uncultured Massilia sp.]
MPTLSTILAAAPARDALAALGRLLRRSGYRFATVTPATHRRVNARPGNALARDLRGVFGWSRPWLAGTLAPDVDALLRGAGLAAPCPGIPGAWRALVRASTIGPQLYFHSAWPTDDDDAVFFGPDTWRYLAAMRRALDRLQRPVLRAVDVGAGSGAAAIELALRRPRATVFGADINAAALALVEVNAALAGAAGVRPCRSDLLDGVDGGFDLVMSNPPYILDADELPYRHGGGMHGAALSVRIVQQALARLRPGGSLLLYTGAAIVDGADPFLDAVRPLLDAACRDWSYEELDPDVLGGQLGCAGYEDVERIAAVWLHAVRRP